MNVNPYRYLLLILPILLSFCAVPSCYGKEVWHEGQIKLTHSLQPAVHGVVPAGTHLILEDGTDIELASVPADDVFWKLVRYWSTERTDYRAAPPFVNEFMFRLKGIDKTTGLQTIEIQYSANNVYGHRWRGPTHEIKPVAP